MYVDRLPVEPKEPFGCVQNERWCCLEPVLCSMPDLRNWLECQTEVSEGENPAPWSQHSPARRILCPFHRKGEERCSWYWESYLYFKVFLPGSLLRRGAESKNFLFISMHFTSILRLSLTLATAHAMILLCSIGYSDLPLSWTSWDIHFAFLEMNCGFAMCVFRGPDALFMRWSMAERVWYPLFTFQWV